MLYASVSPPFRVVWPTACRCCSAIVRLPHFSTPCNTGRRAMARRFFFCFSGLPPRERGVLPRRGKTPLPASPRPGASRGGRKRRITLTYPPQSRKIARNRTTLGRKWEEISRITADTARFSGKRRKSPGRPARRFLFALCLIGSGVRPQYTTSSFPGAKARSAARQMRSVQPSTPKRAVLRVMS